MLSFSSAVSFTFPWTANDVEICFHVFICLFFWVSFPFFSALSPVLCRLVFSPAQFQTIAESMNQGIFYFSEMQKHLVPASKTVSGSSTPHSNFSLSSYYIPFRTSSPVSSFNSLFMPSLKLTLFLHMISINLFNYFIFGLTG